MEIRIISLHFHLNENMLVKVDQNTAKIGNQFKGGGGLVPVQHVQVLLMRTYLCEYRLYIDMYIYIYSHIV